MGLPACLTPTRSEASSTWSSGTSPMPGRAPFARGQLSAAYTPTTGAGRTADSKAPGAAWGAALAHWPDDRRLPHAARPVFQHREPRRDRRRLARLPGVGAPPAPTLSYRARSRSSTMTRRRRRSRGSATHAPRQRHSGRGLAAGADHRVRTESATGVRRAGRGGGGVRPARDELQGRLRFHHARSAV